MQVAGVDEPWDKLSTYSRQGWGLPSILTSEYLFKLHVSALGWLCTALVIDVLCLLLDGHSVEHVRID